MERVIVRFLSGSQANQERSFTAAELSQGLSAGRDPACRIVLETNEDSVSRQHARLEGDPNAPYSFWVADLNSSNGTYVNGARIEGRAKVEHGDVIRLGHGGPEFSVLADPAPPAALRPTRVVNVLPEPAATREIRVDELAATAAPADPAGRNVGRATVERLIGEERKSSARRLVQVGALAAAAVALVAGWQFYQARDLERKAEQGRIAVLDSTSKTKIDTDAKTTQLEMQMGAARRISDSFAPSTVYIETAWKLVETNSGKQVFHMYLPPRKNKDGSTTPKLPMYYQSPDGAIEPVVWTDDGKGLNEPIGDGGRGSGFVVSESGFALTNKHVVAGWFMPYNLPAPGVLVGSDGKGGVKPLGVLPEQQIKSLRWIPARAAMLGGKNFEFKQLEGRVDFLDVTFTKNKLRIPSRIARVSNEHDVALIKIDTPTALKKVELWDNYEQVRAGDPVVLLGYPAISPLAAAVTTSKEMNASNQRDVTIIPDVTVNQGIISRALRGAQKSAGAGADEYVSMFGDVYQVAINTAGAGNSGGPLFSPDGRVIGIHTYGRSMAGATVSFATPIRFALPLLDVQAAMR